jgi:hypothetical protein
MIKCINSTEFIFRGADGSFKNDAGLKTEPKKYPSCYQRDGYKVAIYSDSKIISWVEVHQLFAY